jgi:hypothetical protein
VGVFFWEYALAVCGAEKGGWPTHCKMKRREAVRRDGIQIGRLCRSWRVVQQLEQRKVATVRRVMHGEPAVVVNSRAYLAAGRAKQPLHKVDLWTERNSK